MRIIAFPEAAVAARFHCGIEFFPGPALDGEQLLGRRIDILLMQRRQDRQLVAEEKCIPDIEEDCFDHGRHSPPSSHGRENTATWNRHSDGFTAALYCGCSTRRSTDSLSTAGRE